MKNRLLRGLIVGLSAFLITLILHNLQIFKQLEWKSWDMRLRLFSNPSQASGDIVLFFVDQASLDIYEQEQGLPWPWPRQIYSAVIRYCEKGGAKALAFDLSLTESSRYGVEDDRDFSDAMAEAGNIFLPIFLSREEKEIEEMDLRSLEKFSKAGENVPQEFLFPVKSATLPVHELLRSARGAGNVNLAPDGDGIYRRIPLLFSYRDLVLPSLPVTAVDFLKDEFQIHTVPLDDSGRMIIRFYGPRGTYQSYSIASIINSFALMEEGKAPQIHPEGFAGKIILVGTSAPGLYDLRPTPFSSVYPGVEILATVIDNLLHRDFVRLPSWGIFILLLVFSALLAGIVTSLLDSAWKIAIFFPVYLALPVGAAFLAFFSGYWLDLVSPVFVAVLSFIGASLLNYSFEGRQRRFVKSVFRYYLNPHLIEKILKDPSLLQLGGEKREISSFFSDIAGFTPISESLSPEDLVNILNAYLSEMTDIILASGGTLDKYEGDAIIAFWNAPLDRPDHALSVCQAALKCQKRLAELRGDFKKQYGQELFMRIGINTGPAIVGNMGSRNRFDYTAIGDTINLAARLEGACKQYNVPILIGETTYEKVKDAIVAKEVDLIRVVGKEAPVRVFEIIGEKEQVSSSELESIKTFHLALEAYRKRQWENALSLFQKSGNDMLAQMFIARCESFMKTPPPDDWIGVYDLKEK